MMSFVWLAIPVRASAVPGKHWEQRCAIRILPTVLVVDDHPDTAELVASLLEGAGYAIIKASSACQAVDVLDAHRDISLILSDVRMPSVDGFDFLRLVRQRYPALPMVLMTGLPITSADFVPRGARILQKTVRYRRTRARRLGRDPARATGPRRRPLGLAPVTRHRLTAYRILSRTIEGLLALDVGERVRLRRRIEIAPTVPAPRLGPLRDIDRAAAAQNVPRRRRLVIAAFDA